MSVGWVGTMEMSGDQWWRFHITHTREYLQGSLLGDGPRAMAALQGLWDAVLEWQRITGSWQAGLLMAEHTALAKLLVDGLAKRLGPGAATTAVEALMENVRTHAKLFPGDPAGFSALFGEHTRLAAVYSIDLAEGRQRDFEAHFDQATKNGDDLGRFTDRMFPKRAADSPVPTGRR